jgi:hypothetical protein
MRCDEDTVEHEEAVPSEFKWNYEVCCKRSSFDTAVRGCRQLKFQVRRFSSVLFALLTMAESSKCTRQELPKTLSSKKLVFIWPWHVCFVQRRAKTNEPLIMRSALAHSFHCSLPVNHNNDTNLVVLPAAI